MHVSARTLTPMRQSTRCAPALLLTLLAAPPAGADTVPVRVAGGLVSGAPGRDAAITVFKGLPFVAPPVGDLRWRAPRPVVPWTRIGAATRSACSTSSRIPS